MNYRRKLLVLAAAAIFSGAGTFALGGTAWAADAGMHVDQVGYLTGHNKIAMVTDSKETTFALVDAQTGAVVYQGELSGAKLDKSSAENLRTADFSKFDQAGTYKLKVGSRESYAFKIGDNIYALPAVETWRSYTLTRCNNTIDDAATGLKIKNGHAQDDHAIAYFSDDMVKKGEVLDETGGWYDAGDYGKYIPTAAIASAQMMLAYEAHPDHFTRGQMQFPEGIETDEVLPDGLAEVKYELNWMRKMQREDGSTFHKVAGIQWTGAVRPDEDLQPRYILGMATYDTAMYGATMAMAARVFEPFDKVYAKGLLDDARLAWDYLQKHPERIFRFDEGQDNGSGNYNTDTDKNQRLWLAAELFRTTGDKAYEQYLAGEGLPLMTAKPSMYGWGHTQALAQFAYLKAGNADAGLRDKVQQAFLGSADDILHTIREDGLGCALYDYEFCWASTKNAVTKGDFLLMAYQFQPKPEYLEGALDQIHYLFGRNSLDQSFMTGIGSKPPMHPHNRIMNSTGVYIPGVMVGGPNKYEGGDPVQTSYIHGGKIPAAKCYLDNSSSWSMNEYAIDYTATAAYALAWFAKPEAVVLPAPQHKAND